MSKSSAKISCIFIVISCISLKVVVIQFGCQVEGSEFVLLYPIQAVIPALAYSVCNTWFIYLCINIIIVTKCYGS